MFTVFLNSLAAIIAVSDFVGMKTRSVLIVLTILGITLPANGLTLEQALQLALRENNTISVVTNRVAETRAKVATAQTAYWPQFQLNATYNYVSRLPKFKIALPLPVAMPEIRTATHHMGDAKLQGGYLLFDFGRRRKTVGLAVLGREVAETNLEGSRQEVAYQVMRGYASAALIREQKNLLERYIETSQKHLHDAQVLFDNGLASQFDLLKSEMQVKVYQEQLAIIDAELRTTLLNLGQTIGSDSITIPEISEKLVDLNIAAPEVSATAVTAFAENKPEVIALRKQQEMSQLTAGLEQLRPSVSLVSSAGWKNSYMPNPDKLLFNYSGGVAFSYAFFDGGRARSRRAEELEKQKTIDLDIERIVSQTSNSVEVIRTEIDKISAKSRITSEKLAIARKALEIASVSYSTGMITNSDYLDTELEVQKIETDGLTDLYSLLLARLELKKTLSSWPELNR